jgi:HlyD family secretion protein
MPTDPAPEPGTSDQRAPLNPTSAVAAVPATIGRTARTPASSRVAPLPVVSITLGRNLWRWRWRVIAVLIVIGVALYVAIPWLLGPIVPAQPVLRGALIQSVVASGRAETPHRVNIGSQITGTVASVPVREGQAVAVGQVLVTLEDSELRASVEQAEAAMAQAEARVRQIVELTLPVARENLSQAQSNLLNAQQQYARAESLRSGGFETQVQLDNARRTLNIAQAQVRAAQAQVAGNVPSGTEYVAAEAALRAARASLLVALSRLDYTRILALEAGTLIARNVERGWVVQPNQVLMVLSPIGQIEIVVQIDEKNLGLVAVGQQAMASADAYPDQRFAAELAYINPAVDPARAAVEVKLRVVAPPDYLRQDMTVSVDIAVAERADTLVLPVSAVHDAAGDAPWVLRIENGRAHRRAVRIGLRGPQRVEILEGLREGDLVVPSGVAIADGGRVRPVPAR